ncbi:MAG: nucleoside triphosphate pyrophosphohydrolase [Alphaproteobacteria bacterium]
MSVSPAVSAVGRLLEVMRRLRDPEAGCPWDVEQTFASIAPYTIEEAYEVADAIGAQDMVALREELGDLLLQVVYHAQMAAEAGAFDFEDVAAGITDKMVARHPHVFGDAEIRGAAAQTQAWEARKSAERAAKAAAAGRRASVLDGIALALPALVRAEKLQKRAARVGFDWADVARVLDKVEEEIAELRAECGETADRDRVEDEFGDVLFSIVNLGRHLGLDGEAALRRANAKFERRFRRLEERLGVEGKSPEACTLAELEATWVAVKAEQDMR